MTELICIICPKGCRLKVDEDNGYSVTGNGCKRGIDYGRSEVTNPMRVVTSTICVAGGVHPRCPVKTSKPIPKSKVLEAMRTLNNICIQAPIIAGQTVVSNVCGTGVDFIATRNIPKT